MEPRDDQGQPDRPRGFGHPRAKAGDGESPSAAELARENLGSAAPASNLAAAAPNGPGADGLTKAATQRLWVLSFLLGAALGILALNLILRMLDWPHWMLLYAVVGIAAGLVGAELTRSAFSGRDPE